MIDWQIGCSGFFYKHWKEAFYPLDLPQRKWFEYYCDHFNTLELNVTFYRFPKVPSLRNWYKRSPEKFLFAVKAPRVITHFKQFHGTADMISDFYRAVSEGLGDKLGCVLFQMPPRIKYTPERLERITQSLDNSFNNVLEFRHESWWENDVYDALSSADISFCGMSHPQLPADIIQNTGILYYRFHGVPELYKSSYKRSEIKNFITSAADSVKTKRAYIYFNNDIGASAIANAREMKKMVK